MHRSRSVVGRFTRVLARIFALVCIYRIIMVHLEALLLLMRCKATLNVVRGKREMRDPMNRLLKFSLMVFDVKIDNEVYDGIMTYISFIFIGTLQISTTLTCHRNHYLRQCEKLRDQPHAVRQNDLEVLLIDTIPIGSDRIPPD